MEDIFVQKIHINKVRHLENIDIEIDSSERKHLILTGKNGSGKTSVLEGVRDFLKAVENSNLRHFSAWYQNIKKIESSIEPLRIKLSVLSRKNSMEYKSIENQVRDLTQDIITYQNTINQYKGKTDLEIKNVLEIVGNYQIGNFILAFFEAKRGSKANSFQDNNQQKGFFKEPKGIERVEFKEKYAIEEPVNINFIQHLVNLKADRSFAKDENDQDTVNAVDSWFERFEKNLKGYIFHDENLKLDFDRKNYTFNLSLSNREKVTLNELSDGYASILYIVSELMMRMENKQAKNYDIQGIVLIDEIETHLHIDLQKKILPFLTTFFPKIQFIVTTHSPFVLNSISNAVIYDLEKKMRVENLSAYAIDGIVEGYFESDKYSAEIKEKVNRYENLLALNNPNSSEKEEILSLRKMLKGVSPQLAPELVGKFLDLELSRIGK
jgi:predicted ATP-binding protein involved in virulence